MEIENHEKLVRVEDSIEFLVSLTEEDGSDPRLEQALENFVWAYQLVRHQEAQIHNYEQEIEILLSQKGL